MTSTILKVSALAALSLFSIGLQAAADGLAVYNQNCAMCHTPGLANAPKLGDKAGWGPRLAAGRAALLEASIKGKGAMPPRAGNPKLTDEELASGLDYMLSTLK